MNYILSLNEDIFNRLIYLWFWQKYLCKALYINKMPNQKLAISQNSINPKFFQPKSK